MKKLFLLLFFIVSIKISSQTCYYKQKEFKYIVYTGTLASYDSAIALFSIDPISSFYIGPDAYIVGNYITPGLILTKTIDEPYLYSFPNWTEFEKVYVYNRQNAYPPYVSNLNGYITNLSTFSTTNLLEGSNLYFTTPRARTSVSLTTNGTSGVATYNNTTGVFNIPNYGNIFPSIGTNGQLLRVNSGATALEYFTPSYISSNQTITLTGDVTGSGATSINTSLANSGITAGTYASATFDSKGRATSGLNWTIPTSTGSRSFNTAYRESTTNLYNITVSPQLSCNLSLSGGQAGTVTLEISANGTSGWIAVGILSGSNTGTLTIGLNTTQVTGCQLSYDVPATYYWRLSTSNLVGSPTYTYNGGSYKILQ